MNRPVPCFRTHPFALQDRWLLVKLDDPVETPDMMAVGAVAESVPLPMCESLPHTLAVRMRPPRSTSEGGVCPRRAKY